MEPNISTIRKEYYDGLKSQLEKTGRVHDVPYKSNAEPTPLPVYEIPLGDDFETGLRFNLDNSRIIKHVLSAKAKGEMPDPEKPETQEFIEKILLNDKLYSKHAVSKLKDNLRSVGQTEPIIVSCDGTIWNGNRRVAVIKMLYKETGDPRWSKAKGVFLPELSKKQLKHLEHRLQLAYNFQEDYDRITLFLGCRERHDAENWSYEELENSFGGRYTKKKIKEFIEQINLIDEYLERIGCSGDYPSLGDTGVEFFASTQTHLNYEKNKLGTGDVDLAKIATEFFVTVKHPDSTYRDARHLCYILRNEKARRTYLENSPIYNNYAEYTSPNSEGQEKAFHSDTVNAVRKNVDLTYVELRAMSGDTPFDLADKALRKLNEIKEEDIEPADPTFFDKIEQIEDRTRRLKSYLKNV